MTSDVEWHPRKFARPTEWTIQVPGQPEPIAIVRLVKIAGRPSYRAVTWAPTSSGRELIGYYPNGDDAAVAVWRKYVADNERQHELASRTHGSDERSRAR